MYKWEEREPLLENYLALYITIVWYKPINSDEAFRLVEGRSNMKKMCREITPDIEKRVLKIVQSPCFKNMDRLSRRFGISKRDLGNIVRQHRVNN